MGFFDLIFGKKKTGNSVASNTSSTPDSVSIPNLSGESCYLLLFSAKWCGPSKRFIKAIEDAGMHSFTLIDVEENEDLSEKYSVRSVPTTILIKQDGTKVETWVGYDDEDPAQTQFVNYIRKCKATILPYPLEKVTKESAAPAQTDQFSSSQDDPKDELMALLNKVIGTKDAPAQVEKQNLSDGSVYTGGAVLLTDGSYLPQGFGKKKLPSFELTGFFDEGNVNGVCYMNMHFAMVLGHFKDSRPNGWCMCIENGYQFGVMRQDDFTNCISNHMTWIAEMIKGISGSPIHTFSKKEQILYGLNMKQVQEGLYMYSGPTGMFFMNNGDVFFGTDDRNLTKTGVFVKYGADGFITIGRFDNGCLVEQMSIQQVFDYYFGSTKETEGLFGPIKPKQIRLQLADFEIDTRENYF